MRQYPKNAPQKILQEGVKIPCKFHWNLPEATNFFWKTEIFLYSPYSFAYFDQTTFQGINCESPEDVSFRRMF